MKRYPKYEELLYNQRTIRQSEDGTALHAPQNTLPVPQNQRLQGEAKRRSLTTAERKRSQAVFECRVRVHVRRYPLPPAKARQANGSPADNGGAKRLWSESLHAAERKTHETMLLARSLDDQKDVWPVLS